MIHGVLHFLKHSFLLGGLKTLHRMELECSAYLSLLLVFLLFLFLFPFPVVCRPPRLALPPPPILLSSLSVGGAAAQNVQSLSQRHLPPIGMSPPAHARGIQREPGRARRVLLPLPYEEGSSPCSYSHIAPPPHAPLSEPRHTSKESRRKSPRKHHYRYKYVARACPARDIQVHHYFFGEERLSQPKYAGTSGVAIPDPPPQHTAGQRRPLSTIIIRSKPQGNI